MIKRNLARLVDALYPPRCMVCEGALEPSGAEIAGGGTGLCPACWGEVRFINPPVCSVCGVPFDFGVEAGREMADGDRAQGLCGACLAHPPAYDRARAVFVYDDASRGLVTRFKYSDRVERAPVFGRWMARALMRDGGAPYAEALDVIIPVPLHAMRLFTRRFNQAGLLAQEIGRVLEVPVAVDALKRVRRTRQQVGLTPAQRRRNVAKAFTVRESRRVLVENARILLVDDVLTSGATIETVTRVLKQAGAQSVTVVTLARVDRQ